LFANVVILPQQRLKWCLRVPRWKLHLSGFFPLINCVSRLLLKCFFLMDSQLFKFAEAQAIGNCGSYLSELC
jgi:hypothetical protein